MNEDIEPALEVVRAKPIQATAEERAQWAKRYLESGLSLRKFSAQHSLPWYALWRWVKKADRTQALTTEELVSVASSSVCFTEVKLPATAEESRWVAEVKLPNGMIVRVSREAPAAMVEQLLHLC
jgi:transposase-like protein